MKTNKKTQKLYSVIYYTMVLLVFILTSGLIPLGDKCFYFSKIHPCLALLSLFIFVPVLGLIYSIVSGVEKPKRVLFYGMIPIIFGMTNFPFSLRTPHLYIERNECIVRKAIVTDKFIGKVNQSINIKYKDDQYIYRRTYNNYRLRIKDIEIGDSILIMHVDGCTELSRVYNAKPTAEEWAKCKEYGYLIDGKLYSKEEYENEIGK
jgi:hypothetical protein